MMLIATSTAETDWPCIVEVDPYVPLSFKTYPGVLPGAYYFRIGNFETSLLEIGIDPLSLVVRHVCLVSFDKVLTQDQISEPRELEESMGLPVASPSSLSGDRTDELCNFGVCLCNDSLVIDWSHNKVLSTVVRFQKVSFYLAERELRRVVFNELSSIEHDLLSEHLFQTPQ